MNALNTDYLDKQFTEKELDILAQAVCFDTEAERRQAIAALVTWAAQVRINSDILEKIILQEKALVDITPEKGVILKPLISYLVNAPAPDYEKAS